MNATKLITEFIGTFFLCLVVALNANAGVANLIAIGSILMVMVYAGGHISGAHYNPAVTLAVLVRGRIATGEAIMYWVAQIIGGVVAALIAQSVFGSMGSGGSAMSMGTTPGLVGEILGTFALAYVVLNVATSKATAGNSYYGLAIGFTVLTSAYAGGGISGGAYNPAVGLGPSIFDTMMGGSSISHVWLYLVGPFVGGALAATMFKFLNPDE